MKDSTINLTIHPRAIAACSLFAAVKDPRYYLQGIYVRPGEAGGVIAVATNGHALLEVFDPSGTCDKAAILQFSKRTLSACAKSYKVPVVLTVTDTLAVIDGISDFVTFADGTFPDYLQIIPDSWNVSEMAVSAIAAPYMIDICKAAMLICKDKQPTIHTLTRGNTSACFAFGLGIGDMTARGLVMPQSKAGPITWDVPVKPAQVESLAA